MTFGPLSRLLWVLGLWSLALALSDTFVNAFLWSVGQNLEQITAFNLLIFVGMVPAFLLGGHLSRRCGARLPLQLAICIIAAFLLIILLLANRAAALLYPLGLFAGVGFGLYWLAYYVHTSNLTRPRLRDWIQGMTGAVDALAMLVGPPLGGYIIAHMVRLAGYRLLFAVSAALLLGSLVLTRGLPNEGDAHGTRGFRLRAALAGARGSGRHRVLWGQAALAIRDGVYHFAPALLVFVYSHSALDLGAYATATSLVSTVTYYLAGRLSSRHRRHATAWLGVAVGIAAALVLALGVSVVHLWIFGLGTALASPLLKVPVEARTLDVIGNEACRPFTVELTVVKEVVINTARSVTAIALVLALAAWTNADVMRWGLVGLSLAPLGLAVSLSERPHQPQNWPATARRPASAPTRPHLSRRRPVQGPRQRPRPRA